MRTVIGKFIQDQYGVLHGKICGLGIGVMPVIFQPQPDKKEGQPDFKLIADPMLEAFEIGAAWQKQKDGMTYYSVSIESPALMAPLYTALFQDRDNSSLFNLVFDRYQQTPAVATAAGLQGRRYIGADATP